MCNASPHVWTVYSPSFIVKSHWPSLDRWNAICIILGRGQKYPWSGAGHQLFLPSPSMTVVQRWLSFILTFAKDSTIEFDGGNDFSAKKEPCSQSILRQIRRRLDQISTPGLGGRSWHEAGWCGNQARFFKIMACVFNATKEYFTITWHLNRVSPASRDPGITMPRSWLLKPD